MKKKVGTIMDEKLLAFVKQRAAAEDRSLSGLIEEALTEYLGRGLTAVDKLRALDKFISHGGLLQREEIEEILGEDILV
ncbi:MAG: ribbon-helix-helix protein, CopG family [Clostridiales bacterium]|nr:ribbon-helix-helix protein, CopG family [Clostridiales bacterium]